MVKMKHLNRVKDSFYPCFDGQYKQPMIMRIALCRTNHVTGIERQPRQVRLTHRAQSEVAASSTTLHLCTSVHQEWQRDERESDDRKCELERQH